MMNRKNLFVVIFKSIVIFLIFAYSTAHLVDHALSFIRRRIFDSQ